MKENKKKYYIILMLTLINILICFFLFLIIYQIFLASVVEGFDNTSASNSNNQYQEYDMNNPSNALILAQQNAGNISYLKNRLGDFDNLNQQIQDLSNNMVSLQSSVDQIVQAQQDYANQMTGGSPPDVTGAVDDEDDTNTSNNIDTNNTDTNV